MVFPKQDTGISVMRFPTDLLLVEDCISTEEKKLCWAALVVVNTYEKMTLKLIKNLPRYKNKMNSNKMKQIFSLDHATTLVQATINSWLITIPKCTLASIYPFTINKIMSFHLTQPLNCFYNKIQKFTHALEGSTLFGLLYLFKDILHSSLP